MIDKNILIRRIICTAVSFILSVCLFAVSMCATLCIACSKEYVSAVGDKSHYAKLSFESLCTELADITIPSGLPIDFFDGKLNEKLYSNRVFEALNANVESAYLSYSTDEITDEFYAIAMEYANSQLESVSEETSTALRGFATECSSRYVKYANPSSVKYVLTHLKPIRKPLLLATATVVVLCSAAAVLLIFLCRRKDLSKHLMFAFSGAALMSGVLPTLLLLTGEIKRISLTSPALHSLAVTYIEGILLLLLIFAAVLLIPAVVLAAVKLVALKKK